MCVAWNCFVLYWGWQGALCKRKKKKKKMCNFSQFLIPGFSINSTLTLLPRKLVGVSGELITSFQTKRSPHSVFPTRFLWATKAIPCSSPESPRSLKPEPLLIPGISHFLLQTICQPSGGNPVGTAAGVGRKNEVTSPCRRQSQLYPARWKNTAQ